MEEWIERPGPDTIPVMHQLFHHGEAEDRLVQGMDEDVNANEPVIEFALVTGHTIEYNSET